MCAVSSDAISEDLAWSWRLFKLLNNNNLAIANRSRVSCAHNTSTASVDLITHDLKMWVRGHSRSLKIVPFESLGTVFYSPSIVTMAVSLAISEIFSFKEWPDREIWVWGCSRSLKMHWKWRGSVDHVWHSISPPLYHLRDIWHWIIPLPWPWNLA